MADYCDVRDTFAVPGLSTYCREETVIYQFMKCLGICILISLGLSLYHDYKVQENNRMDAISHGCAAYDRVTGEWGWINNETITQDALGIPLPAQKRKK